MVDLIWAGLKILGFFCPFTEKQAINNARIMVNDLIGFFCQI